MNVMLDENRNAPEVQDWAGKHTQINPGCTLLRRTIQKNIVSFPSQIPAFAKQLPAGMQWRMVLLFFVQGWSLNDVAVRFKVPKHRVCRILNTWAARALALGYIDVIDPEAFAECCRVDLASGIDRDAEAPRRGERDRDPQGVLEHAQEPGPAGSASVVSSMDQLYPQSAQPESRTGRVGTIVALDHAIAHCEEWGNEFWSRAATLLRDLRAVAEAEYESRQSPDQTSGRVPQVHAGEINPHHELGISAEEHLSHAVA